MKKHTLLVFYILILLFGAAAITYTVWHSESDDATTKAQQEEYKNIKTTLLSQASYDTSSSYMNIEITVNDTNSWLNVSFNEPNQDLHNVVILIVSSKEKSNLSDTIYPSIGIFDNFNCILVKDNPNPDLKRYKSLNLRYSFISDENELLIYTQFALTQDGALIKTCISTQI